MKNNEEDSKVSVVVPSYNHASFLRERLDSVFNQTFKNFEVILLDDGSTDNSLEILRNYEDHPKVSHCVFEDKNSGYPFRQWKKGIDLAEGDYIWIAESDDWAEVQFLEKLVPALNETTGVAFCKSYTYFDAKKKLSRYYFPEDQYPEQWRESHLFEGRYLLENFHSHINTIPNASSAVFKKDLAHFDDDLLSMKFCGDWLFWGRLMTKTNVYFHSERLNYWRSSKQTVRAAKKNGEEKFDEMIECLKKINSLTDNKKFQLSKYDWLFLSYFSEKSLSLLLFYKKPSIPVKTITFKLYLIRASFHLFIKRIKRAFLELRNASF